MVILTGIYGEKILVNDLEIVYVLSELNAKTNKELYSKIIFKNGNAVAVKESPTQIINLLAKGSR